MALIAAPRHRMIVWSIDGFAAGYFDREEIIESAVWQRLLKRGRLFRPVETTTPSVTYPAHTAMVTGRDTAHHQVHGNHPVDIFNDAKDGWTWYAEDIAGPTLWGIAKKCGKKVANLQWPVTMLSAGRIAYHVPQFDRAKGPEEEKLMRVLSTPGLYRDIEENTGVALTEHSSDTDRIRAARYVWKSRKPDLMLLYNPGLDTIEHGDGPYSKPAFKHLEKLGHEIEAFLDEIERGADAQHIRVLIVSDHGFLTYQGKCFPNSILKSMGYIDIDARRWSYYFETAGGVARLVRNEASAPGVAAPFAEKAFAERLQTSCPGIEVVGEGHDLFGKLRQSYDKNSSLFLVSKDKTVMTAAINKVEFADVKGHTHGFLPDRPDMHTVAILFGSGRAKAQKIRHVKQVFGGVCSWLNLKCPAQKSAAAPR
jgi:hypothetical protein